MKLTRHPYRYDGTDVLINKEGIRNQRVLDRRERTFSKVRMMTLREQPITTAGYCVINRHLFQDIYEWAGKYRTVDTGRAGSPFCSAEFIEANMNFRFSQITNEQFLRGLDPRTFAHRASEHLNELNAIHPFIEGNGRTNRAFFKILANQAGYQIDLARVDPKAWNHASIEGFNQNYEPMTEILFGTITGGINPPEPPPPAQIRGKVNNLRPTKSRPKSGGWER